MKTVSFLVAVMVVVTARAAAEEPKKKGQARPGAARRWKMPPRLGPDDCSVGQPSATAPDAKGWMRYECWRIRDRWLFVLAAYPTYQEAQKRCIATYSDKDWARVTVLPGLLFSNLKPTWWYCLSHGHLEETEWLARDHLEAYKGLVRREGNKTVKLRKDEAFLREGTTYQPLMDRDGRPIKADGVDFSVMSEKVLLAFKYTQRPGYVPKGMEKKCPSPFLGTVASFGPSRRELASATLVTDGIRSVCLGRFSDGSYVLRLRDGETVCEQDRSHLLVWTRDGSLRDWKTFAGVASCMGSYPGDVVPVSKFAPEGHYGVRWDGKRLKRIEGDFEPK